jgi:hypothetical protein
MARRLGTRGYVGYRRGDAAALRMLSRVPSQSASWAPGSV